MNYKTVAWYSFLIVIVFIFVLFLDSIQTKTLTEPNYSVGTPIFDRMLLTNDEDMDLENGQRAVVIGADVMYLWLGNAANKKIISVVAFDRGTQGSTSSFLIIYEKIK